MKHPRPADRKLPQPIAELRRELCERFEADFRRGTRPRIEHYLADVRPPDRADLLRELLIRELQLRIQAGEEISRDDYRGRFKAERETVEAALAAVVEVTPGALDDTSPHLVKQILPGSAIPERIGRFVVRQVLGRGSFGVVYLADDPRLGRSVAVKVPRMEPMLSSEHIHDYLDEARKSAKLDHPGIVTIHDVQFENDQVYIVQEYLDGGTLQDLYKQRPLPSRRAAELVLQIADALAHAHQRGVVHRDLKPANILLDHQGKTHVADFGLAWDEYRQPGARSLGVGSPRYMAPEVVRGDLSIDGRCDLWGLGVILYELLTGQSPFGGRTQKELLQQILERIPKPPRQHQPQLPPELNRICLKCLEKSLDARYQSATDLAQDLSNWLAQNEKAHGRATPHPDEAATHRPTPSPWASTRAIVAWGLIGAAVVAGGAWGSRQFLPDTFSKPPEGRLQFERFEVLHYRGDPALSLGILGKESPEAREDDNVRVRATLSMPAYCYLLALNPDGTLVTCPPGSAAEAPRQVTEITYPSASDRLYGLTEGPGIQAFVLIASLKPLPAFQDWPGRSQLEWRSHPLSEGVWHFDGRRMERISRPIRSERRVASVVPDPIEALGRWLARLPGVDRTELIAFPVQPWVEGRQEEDISFDDRRNASESRPRCHIISFGPFHDSSPSYLLMGLARSKAEGGS